VHELLNRGYIEEVDADLKGYFDTIPHNELMKSIARRVSDAGMLKLVKAWLEMAVEETDERGNKRLFVNSVFKAVSVSLRLTCWRARSYQKQRPLCYYM
jgi:hypothetical protein